jgi:polysaccharide deacetylase family protein (PEP-CTERM system associated)
MLNVISVDVEEYFHAANLEPFIGPARWHSVPSRVEWATERTLELFDTHNARGTFFILGSTARRHTNLVRRIAEAGHEIASHGYGHRLAYEQSPKSFYRDVVKSKRILEQISGREVLGYRAPNFSIKEGNAWAYDELIRAGYRYDSSLYPIWHPRYANAQRSLDAEIIQREKGQIIVFPLAVSQYRIFGRNIRIPVAGGAYWRLFPRFIMKQGLKKINNRGAWFITYFHPWELDAEQPRVKGLSFLTRLRHYGGVDCFDDTIAYFLKGFSFVPLIEAAEQTLPIRAVNSHLSELQP